MPIGSSGDDAARSVPMSGLEEKLAALGRVMRTGGEESGCAGRGVCRMRAWLCRVVAGWDAGAPGRRRRGWKEPGPVLAGFFLRWRVGEGADGAAPRFHAR